MWEVCLLLCVRLLERVVGELAARLLGALHHPPEAVGAHTALPTPRQTHPRQPTGSLVRIAPCSLIESRHRNLVYICGGMAGSLAQDSSQPPRRSTWLLSGCSPSICLARDPKTASARSLDLHAPPRVDKRETGQQARACICLVVCSGK